MDLKEQIKINIHKHLLNEMGGYTYVSYYDEDDDMIYYPRIY